MSGVSAEQVQAAHEVDLLSYLQANEPQELLPPKNGEYSTISHGSLVISNGKWVWNRGGVGGRSAVDYLVKVRGMGFVEAVETVLRSRAAPAYPSLPVESAPPKQLRLSHIWSCATHVFDYLQKRGISSEVIGLCMKKGFLYESRYNGAPVCVFVGRDGVSKERFACIRGIVEDLKRDCAGSDKRYGFCLPAKKTEQSQFDRFRIAYRRAFPRRATAIRRLETGRFPALIGRRVGCRADCVSGAESTNHANSSGEHVKISDRMLR